ncbi:MAG: hypothetical protein K9N23_04055 [Akkermansiaceae bacterium]|nr:hypothetical protein [Akkermansiaceae bacterium]
MKTIWSKLAVFVFTCFVSLQLAHAGVTLSGKQTAGSAGSNAKLECTAVTVSSPMTISAVSGSNEGFWIQQGSSTVMKFYKSNDPSAVGQKLQAGTYYVYPNLKKGSSAATVTVTLK